MARFQIPVIFRRFIFDRLFPTRGMEADVVRRWQRVAADEPELVNDIIRMGGVLTLPILDTDETGARRVPVDPIRLAMAEGRRQFAVELTAMMSLTGNDLAKLMEVDDASL